MDYMHWHNFGEILLLRRKNDAGKVGRVLGKIGILVWSGKIGRP